MDKCICKDCFYDFRTDREVTCNHAKEEKISVTWNSLKNMYQTTESFIRPPPKYLAKIVKTGSGVAMCDPHIGPCRGDSCSFAHGRAEQKEWNSFLLSSGKSGEIMSYDSKEGPIFMRANYYWLGM